MSVKRIYVEKKQSYAVRARELREEINHYLHIHTITDVRVLIRYDIENVTDETYQEAKGTIFSEPPMDILYEEEFSFEDRELIFLVEYLPGQFDQRADSAEQCIKLLNESEEPVIRSATTYIVSGQLTLEQTEAIKNFCINPVDSREAEFKKPETLLSNFEEPKDILFLGDFSDLQGEELQELYHSLNLAMTFKDFLHIQNYYKEEKRDPSMTEICVLDTYWSDHCRHTTFQTELKQVSFTEGEYKKPIQAAYESYLRDREEIVKNQKDKFVSLMDLALMAMKKLRKDGKLEDLEISDEINACSIIVPVEIDGESEEWLINFKNETHNHPTEIEPFGGAATCLGGAIRDPLSGRTYVYQAMRITGAADPTKALNETIKGKLPQKKIVTEAAAGYSSYGNQIGLATGLVREIYHPDYVAKRMEIGAVMGAAPRKNVVREDSDPGDIVILLGGRTGRDGCGGATGSSKVHTENSIETCGAEVQKGNAPTERKIQRLFRRPEASLLIKKCNDFGAGGVSVAIGELAPGVQINLDKVTKKYAGLDGTEIAISESQERMAVVVDPKNVDLFLNYAKEENLEAVEAAVITEEARLVMEWRGETIVDISRVFLDTNGAHQETDVVVQIPDRTGSFFIKEKAEQVKEKWLETLGDLNVCSQKGLVEMFDGSIGAGSVYMPFGGKNQMTPIQTMIAKLPLLKGSTNTVTMMSYGFDPYLSSWSPYHGAVYAVLSSVAKIVAAGGDYRSIRFTFQEYFKRMTEDPVGWGQPFSALLGAYSAQMGFGLPSIGGKDSMSGTFQDINVPPTLVSFAVNTADHNHIITPELKRIGSKLVLFSIEKDAYDLPVYDQVKDQYDMIFEHVKAGRIISAYALERDGLAAAVSKMAFGNGKGVQLDSAIEEEDLFAADWGAIVAEVPGDMSTTISGFGRVIGEITAERVFRYKDVVITIEEAIRVWTKPLEKVFPTKSGILQKEIPDHPINEYRASVSIKKVKKPTVFIPVFPGTNCEYDSSRAFEQAGAHVITKVFQNQTSVQIRDSIEAFQKSIVKSQIVMFPGGFSAGDEPDGSAKFFAAVFRNAVMKEELEKLQNERDGLILGICNGFQALVKLGLVPFGEISIQKEDAPSLAKNTIGRHISKMVYTKVVSNKSPWLTEATLGDVYCNPISHGEGRFVADERWLDQLFANGQVSTQYVDAFGSPTMDETWNPNGSYRAIEGITSPDGRVLGKMAHSERKGEGVAKNIYGRQDLKLFESGVDYFSG